MGLIAKAKKRPQLRAERRAVIPTLDPSRETQAPAVAGGAVRHLPCGCLAGGPLLFPGRPFIFDGSC